MTDKLRDQEAPNVFGYDLDPKTLTPKRQYIDLRKGGDYGADPLGDGTFRMVPSGDVVTSEERDRRLNRPNQKAGLLDECSICRRRHGKEITHECE
jgi:hypothetical protein